MKRKRASRKIAQGRVVQAGSSSRGLLLSVAARDLLTNGGRETVTFVAVIKTGAGFAFKPLDLPEGTLTVARRADVDGRRVAIGKVEGLQIGQEIPAIWNDADEQLEFAVQGVQYDSVSSL